MKEYLFLNTKYDIKIHSLTNTRRRDNKLSNSKLDNLSEFCGA